jgi:hypothetical protein
MSISEQELRMLVRETIARRSQPAPNRLRHDDPPGRHHASHLRLPIAAGSEVEGLCLIEPAVRCNHCGFCQSFGH